ncbi:S41 family peptidase [Occallatibacter riparius]|uniref:S41 family peptidase n=1 Tax=Occallatibacter riparius TaxID=1002689 RepID=A0A9J7BPV0_9BACT|nr:S41 family peptidase [Occallatibacter riparius]UWZ84736.1 S41 family peptidase [Occallatibacter riparius]
MSEKIYSLLFRLFPARFRARWQEEALELFRDRAGYERGVGPRLRMWFDILCDFAVSLPLAYMREHEALDRAPVAARPAGPSFTMLDEKPIRSSAYLYGTLLSLAILAGIGFMAKHAGHFPIRADADSSGITIDPWATGAGGDGDGGSTLVLGNGEGTTHVTNPSTVRPISKVVHVADPAKVPFFDAAEKHRVLVGVAAVLKQRYPDAAAAQRLGKSLLGAESTLARTNDPDAFAAAVTRQLRADSRDMHFEVAYLREAAPAGATPTVNDAAYSASMRAANCMMAPSILPHKIGYLKLDWFPDPRVCGESLTSAMKTLSRADGLIIDLRENSGGSPEMVKFLAGWLFDRPTFVWNPRENSAAGMWTHSPMAESGLAGKPVWVLTSHQTYSAAEEFAYNLKMLHRATLVGETTAGATDVGIFHHIDDHFGIGLRESKVPNPYSSPDWAVHGVDPDIRVAADQALETVQRLASTNLARR